MEVKYLTSFADGAAFGESFIWAKARSDEAVIKPARQNRSARIRNSSKGRTGRDRKLFRFGTNRNRALTSKPPHHSPKNKAARRRPSSNRKWFQKPMPPIPPMPPPPPSIGGAGSLGSS